ncbi:MAG TPA: hypothetical protein VGF23_01225 [Gaiellaceae bacterium]|jgi:hypothetical protein
MRGGLLIAVAALAIAAPAAAAPSQVIRGDEKLGAFAIKSDGSLGGAVRALGAPTSRVRSEESCHTRWSSLGMQILFYNLGGQNPCSNAFGRFARATVVGSGWRTSNGLKIGDSLARLRQVFPHSGKHGDWYWLVIRPNRFGYPGHYGGLQAKIQHGRVVAFVLTYQAGGE